MTFVPHGKARRAVLSTSLAVLAMAVAGCAGELSPANNRTTLYIFAVYASPNVAVTVNGNALGTITQQYTGSTTDCTALGSKSAADGVFSVTVSGNQHYAINWTYGNGTTDADAFDATEEFFQVPCLLEPIDAPVADITVTNTTPAATTSRIRSGGSR